MYHILFIHPFIHQWKLGCFYLLAIVNNAAVNIGVQISVWIHAFNSLKYIPRSGIAGSYRNSMFIFLKNGHTVFYGRYTIFYSHKQYKDVETLEPVSPALAGGFLTTVPPGKSLFHQFKVLFFILKHSTSVFHCFC